MAAQPSTPYYTPLGSPQPTIVRPAPLTTESTSPLPTIHILMQVEYEHPSEVPFHSLHRSLCGTPTKYFLSREEAYNYLNRIRKEADPEPGAKALFKPVAKAESKSESEQIVRNLFKTVEGHYQVIDSDASGNWSLGDLKKNIDGGHIIGVAYFRKETNKGIGVWIESNVEGSVEENEKEEVLKLVGKLTSKFGGN